MAGEGRSRQPLLSSISSGVLDAPSEGHFRSEVWCGRALDARAPKAICGRQPRGLHNGNKVPLPSWAGPELGGGAQRSSGAAGLGVPLGARWYSPSRSPGSEAQGSWGLLRAGGPGDGGSEKPGIGP